MGENSKIEWCDHTWNGWIGCTKKSTGCKFCYAEADMDKRRHFAKWGPDGTRRVTTDDYWKKPLKWNREAEKSGKRRIVFCSSLSDVFENWQGQLINSKGDTCIWRDPPEPDRPATLSDMREKLFQLIDATPHLTWLLLTKRPENIWEFWPSDPIKQWDNVWLYTSVENQEQAEKRIPELIKCRDLSPVLGLSCEPLLEQIDLRPWLHNGMINHVIVGGESGPNARPFCSEWAGLLRMQCMHTNVAFFMKQFGSNPFIGKSGKLRSLQLKDSKGGDPEEWPGFYHVRQLPEVQEV